MERRVRVGLAHRGPDRRCENVRAALEAVRDDLESRIASPVLIKPNFLSSENALCCTHVDAVRAVLDFLMSLPEPPVIDTLPEALYSKFGYVRPENDGVLDCSWR